MSVKVYSTSVGDIKREVIEYLNRQQ